MLNQIDNPYIAGCVLTIAAALGFIVYKTLMKLFHIGLKRLMIIEDNDELYGWKYRPVTPISARYSTPIGIKVVLYFIAGILSFIGAMLITYQVVYIGVKLALMFN